MWMLSPCNLRDTTPKAGPVCSRRGSCLFSWRWSPRGAWTKRATQRTAKPLLGRPTSSRRQPALNTTRMSLARQIHVRRSAHYRVLHGTVWAGRGVGVHVHVENQPHSNLISIQFEQRTPTKSPTTLDVLFPRIHQWKPDPETYSTVPCSNEVAPRAMERLCSVFASKFAALWKRIFVSKTSATCISKQIANTYALTDNRLRRFS